MPVYHPNGYPPNHLLPCIVHASASSHTQALELVQRLVASGAATLAQITKDLLDARGEVRKGVVAEFRSGGRRLRERFCTNALQDARCRTTHRAPAVPVLWVARAPSPPPCMTDDD